MFLSTPQRRAFEQLRPPEDNIIHLGEGRQYFLHGKEIFLAGVSEGKGTCADVKDVHIAVFVLDEPSPEEVRSYAFLRSRQPQVCNFSVLRRQPTDDELAEARKGQEPGTLILVGEGIRWCNYQNGIFHFVRDGRKSSYLNTVT